MARRSVRLEERYGRNRCKVDDGSISLQGMPSRTLVKLARSSLGREQEVRLIADLLRQDRS
jgi:hypothetical protein